MPIAAKTATAAGDERGLDRKTTLALVAIGVAVFIVATNRDFATACCCCR